MVFGKFGLMLGVSALLGCSCASMATEVTQLDFEICPADRVDETRTVLNLKDVSRISTAELLEKSKELGFTFELRRFGVSQSRCRQGEIDRNTKAYIIYTGFDESEEYARRFVIVTGSDGMVDLIEARRAYVIPGPVLTEN